MSLIEETQKKILAVCKEALESGEVDHLEVGILLSTLALGESWRGGLPAYYSTLNTMKQQGEEGIANLVAEFGEDVHDPDKRANIGLHDS